MEFRKVYNSGEQTFVVLVKEPKLNLELDLRNVGLVVELDFRQ